MFSAKAFFAWPHPIILVEGIPAVSRNEARRLAVLFCEKQGLGAPEFVDAFEETAIVNEAPEDVIIAMSPARIAVHRGASPKG